MDWNQERIETLTRLWRDGYSASQVARQLGDVSRSAVIGKVHRLGIAGRDAPSRPSVASVRQAARGRASAGGVRRTQIVGAPKAPTAAPRVAFEVSATATIQTLTEHGCRWPIGEPEQADFGFCGRLRTGHGAYCAGHAPLASRRREMKTKEIDHIVTRFSEGSAFSHQPADFSLREIA